MTPSYWICRLSPSGHHRATPGYLINTTEAVCYFCDAPIRRAHSKSSVWILQHNAGTDHSKLESRVDLRLTETQQEQEGLAGDTTDPRKAVGAPSSHVVSSGNTDFDGEQP
jgi:hypothetical protein